MKRARLSILVICSLALCAARAADNSGGRPPNIIFMLIDDMGWTDLGCFNSDLFQTPNIDRLAAQGMKFTDAYSACTVCSPTRAAVMTGKYPARLHVTDWIHGHNRPHAPLKIPEWTHYLPLEEITLAEALKPLGYKSASIGKWHLGDDEKYFPNHQGFDLNIGGYGAGQPPSYFYPYNRAGKDSIPTLSGGKEGEYLTDRLTDEAVKLIEQWKDQPFYLYLPHYGVHTPLQAKPEVVAKYQAKIKPGMRHTNAVYAAMVEAVDDSVGRIAAKLDELKLTGNTIFIFTSDNGGLMKPGNSTNNAPLRVGKGSAYEGGVRVPLIVRWPGVVKPGSVCREPVITVDYYPTLLAAAGASGDAAHNKNVDGVSILPLLKDSSATLNRPAIYWHYPHYHPGGATPYGALRAGDWRLVEFYTDNHVELYNLKEDIGETRDLASSNPAKAKELTEMLHQWRTRVGAQMPTANPAADPSKDQSEGRAAKKDEPKKKGKKAK